MRQMQHRIGDLVCYEGRLWRVAGFDPMSLPDRRVHLENLDTRERVRVPIEDAGLLSEPPPAGPGDEPPAK